MIHVHHVKEANGMNEAELRLLMEAQEALVFEGIGGLGLYHDMQFVFARLNGDDRLGGVLAWRLDDGDVWVQIAYVRPKFRRGGFLSDMLGTLEAIHHDKRIGMGINPENAPMLKATLAVGYRQETVYVWKTPT